MTTLASLPFSALCGPVRLRAASELHSWIYSVPEVAVVLMIPETFAATPPRRCPELQSQTTHS